MSELALSQQQTPARQSAIAPRERRERSAANRVTGRLKQCLDMMVWQGVKDNEAAVTVGFNVLSIRNALHKPHVKAYYLRQIDVLRSRERARNIHRLTEIRDAADNMPAVNAIKLLEQIDSDAPTGGTVRQAGITIVIQGASEPRITQTIEHEPHDVNSTITRDDS